ncbi:hypothetical protein ACJX0J_016597, partial [Zea mays]
SHAHLLGFTTLDNQLKSVSQITIDTLPKAGQDKSYISETFVDAAYWSWYFGLGQSTPAVRIFLFFFLTASYLDELVLEQIGKGAFGSALLLLFLSR